MNQSIYQESNDKILFTYKTLGLTQWTNFWQVSSSISWQFNSKLIGEFAKMINSHLKIHFMQFTHGISYINIKFTILYSVGYLIFCPYDFA